MLKTFLYLIFILSIAVASFRVFELEIKLPHIFLSFFEEKEIGKDIKKEAPIYSFSERIQRGDSYLSQGFVEIARDEYLAAVQQDPNNSSAYLKLAEALRLLKNYQGAIQNLQYVQKKTNSFSVQKALAQNYIHLFDFQSASEILANIPQNTDPEVDYLREVIQFLRLQEGQDVFKFSHTDTFSKARYLQKAFDTFYLYEDSNILFLQALLVSAFLENKDYEFAITLGKNVLTKRSDYRDVWIPIGYAYLHLENYAEAKNALEKAYDLDPTKSETQFFLATAYEEMGAKEQALEFYELAYKNKYEPKIHVVQKIAELSLEFGYYEEAFALYEEFLKLSDKEVDSFIRPIWIALDKLSDFQKAQQLAEWARKRFPGEAQTYNLLAWVEIERGDFQKAQSYINQSFQIDPNFAAAHYNQGRVYEELGMIQEALKSYETSYQNDKDGSTGNLSAQAYNRLLKD